MTGWTKPYEPKWYTGDSLASGLQFAGGTERPEQSIPDRKPHGTSVMSFTAAAPKLAKSCSLKEIEPFLPWQLVGVFGNTKLSSTSRMFKEKVAQCQVTASLKKLPLGALQGCELFLHLSRSWHHIPTGSVLLWPCHHNIAQWILR